MGSLLGLNNPDIYFCIYVKILYKRKGRLIVETERENSERGTLAACKAMRQTSGMHWHLSQSSYLWPKWQFSPVPLWGKARKQGKGTFRRCNWHCSLKDHKALTTAKASFVSKLLCRLLHCWPSVAFTPYHSQCLFPFSDCALRARSFHPWPSSLWTLHSPGAIVLSEVRLILPSKGHVTTCGGIFGCHS